MKTKTILVKSIHGEGAIFVHSIDDKPRPNHYNKEGDLKVVFNDCEYYDLYVVEDIPEDEESKNLEHGEWVTNGKHVGQVNFEEWDGYSVLVNGCGPRMGDYHSMAERYRRVLKCTNEYVGVEQLSKDFVEKYCNFLS